jgi:hypothetical protein
MNATEVARHVASQLEDAELPYAIGGALALGVWGAPRATKDVDIAVFAPLADFERIADALERAGLMFDRRTAHADAGRIGLFVCRYGRMEVDVFLSAHPHATDMLHRRRSVEGLWFVSPEDLCILKLIFGRDKDTVDLERLLAVRTELDLGYVRSWVARIVPAGDRRIAVLDDLERRFPRS